MKHIIIATALLVMSGAVFSQKTGTVESAKLKKQQDREAILRMQGCYKVTFSFAETFSPQKDYQYDNDRKYEKAIELVKVIEDKPNKIVLQHLLVVNDTMVVKHWRQDWTYEDPHFLLYQRREDKTEYWKPMTVDLKTTTGKWSQKVFQVDDSPRYQGIGTWVHVDDRSFWEAEADAPLPRREQTKRDDYNVTKRHSHIEILKDGWVLDQDNDKIFRQNGQEDVLIAQEKGIERFWTGEYNCQAAEDYWAKNDKFWEVVREVWAEKLYADKVDSSIKHIEINLFRSGNVIYMRFFEASNEFKDAKKFDAKKARTTIEKIIDDHITIIRHS